MEVKICNRTTCDLKGVPQPLDNFGKDRSQEDGLNPTCKNCTKKYRDLHKEEKKQYSHQYGIDNKERISVQKKGYYEENKEDKLQYNREHRPQRNINTLNWRKKHPEQVKKISSNFREKNRLKTRKKGRIRSRTPQGKFEGYKASAKSKQRSFTLTFEDHFDPKSPTTFWQKPCTYCKSNIDTIGLDRIDNSKGYTPDNVVSCCTSCNLTRGDRFTYQEMVEIIGPALIKVKLFRCQKENL